MPVQSLDQELCNGCEICLGVCPEDVFRMAENKKAYIKYPDDCVACFVCEFACPTNCIFVTKERAYELPSPL